MNPIQLDAIDRKLLHELVRDARLSQVVLSERVGLSATACARRIQQLEKAGLIRGASIDVNAAMLGYMLTVMVRITLNGQKTRWWRSRRRSTAAPMWWRAT